MKHILSLDRSELRDWLSASSTPPYRADQVLQWIYRHNCTDFAAMTTLPAGLRADLAEHFSLRRAEVLQTQGSFDTAAKTLLRWPDDALTETVLICVQDRNTVCVSTQVGCPVGCAFCASGLDGLQRNLTAGEIVEQVLWMRDRLAADQRISNVVFMGMGEPLANYDNTIKAARIINADWVDTSRLAA